MGISYAACGHDVWVGNAEMCDARGHEFDLVIHVHHEDSPTPGRCKAYNLSDTGEIGHGLFVKYVDGAPLTTALLGPKPYGDETPALPVTARYARGDGRILCHCAAGLCRGPTMAIIAKVARGCTPWQAMSDVSCAMWLGYQSAPMLIREPMTEIFRWYWEGSR